MPASRQIIDRLRARKIILRARFVAARTPDEMKEILAESQAHLDSKTFFEWMEERDKSIEADAVASWKRQNLIVSIVCRIIEVAEIISKRVRK